MPEPPPPVPARRCAPCGTELAPSLLVCPSCGSFTRAAELKPLAETADRAAQSGKLSEALSAWRDALALVPPGTRQHEIISRRIADLGRQVESAPPPGAPPPPPPAGGQPPGRSRWRAAAVAASFGLLLWKFKFVLAFVLAKGKFLLLGLTKAGTIFSMALSAGVYWSIWGWSFAVGLVLSIYVHEMGHVVALQRYGIRATFPMFVPGLGAFVRLKQRPATPREDARVGLAGPIWGLGVALAACGLFLATGSGTFAAIAQVGAWINLFNLLPLGPLDGGRGFASLSRRQRWLAVGGLAGLWFLTAEGLLALLVVTGVVRAAAGTAPAEPDRTALLQYLFLAAALSALCLLPVPTAALP